MSKHYVCGLDDASEKKAKEELNEEAKERLSAVETLRTWIRQQPHLTFTDDTVRLLSFLRTAKFSQLKARERVENYAQLVTHYPRWMSNLDSTERKFLEIIDSGYLVVLPNRDKEGRKVMLYRVGASISKNGEMFAVSDLARANLIVALYCERDDNIQVNGFVMIVDLSGFTAGHLTHFYDKEIRGFKQRSLNAWPGRYKSFHYYNAGAVFDTLMALSRPFLPKKYTERIHVHDTMEHLYKSVDMQLLPDEYLPDDYKGPSAGSLSSLAEKLKREVTSDEFRVWLLDETSENKYEIDETKRPNYKPVQESFRKLAVD